MKIRFVDSLAPDQVRQLHRLYQGEWWTEGRTLTEVEKMLTNTDIVIGAVDQTSDQLVGFARVLTDGVFKALVFDVIVAPDFRNRGLGTQLMDALREHPQLRDVRHLELYCLPEMAPFYERWGFSSNLGDLVLMRSEHRQTTELTASYS